MAYEDYFNNAHAALNKMNPFYTKKESAPTLKEIIVIVSTTNTAIMEKITDRIKVLTDDGFVFGRKVCCTFFFRTVHDANYIRDKLINGCDNADVVVLEATTAHVAATTSQSIANNIKDYFNIK